MSVRYIEVYSAHRNRTRFPNQSSFEIPFSPVKYLLNGSQSFDPLMNGAIYYTWKGKFIIDSGILKNGSRDSNPLLQISNSHMQSNIPNYYLGYHLLIDTPLEVQIRTLIAYNPSTVGVTPDLSYNGVSGGQPYTIFDMSTIEFIHIPAVDLYDNHITEYDQAYTGYYVMDETLSYGTRIVGRQIKFYDQNIRYGYYDEKMPNDWSVNDEYTLRKSLPSEKWTLNTPSYNEGKFIVITLPVGSNQYDDYYRGKYVYFVTNVPYEEYNMIHSVFKPIYGTYYIDHYDAFNRKIYCYPDPYVKNYPTYPSANPVINPSGNVGDTINIVNFTKDNFSPLSYNGSMVSQNQTVCYDVSLINLTIPNVVLTTGSRIAFYPYVYVELRNTTSPSRASSEIIYSNNPQSGKALFIASITDVVQPVISTFVRVDGGQMTQTVKFKPNDSLRFSVYLPDGTPFQTVDPDFMSPYMPNSLLQINAVFSIRRLA